MINLRFNTFPMDKRVARIRRQVRAHPRSFVTMIGVAAIAAWTLGGWLAWFTFDITRGLPEQKAIGGIGDMVQATTLYDAHDKPVFTIFKEQRIEVPLSGVSQHLVDAVVSVEDQRFFDHHGVDLVRVMGAVFANLREGRRAQGGSTITQQLARQSFLTLDKKLRRKVQEVVLAAQLERAYTKREILELYLNKVYFGDGFYGVEAAALGFFGKHAADVDVSEAALLAGLIKSPSAYAPTVDFRRAVARRNVVLDAMRAAGALDGPTYASARAEEVVLRNALQREEGFGLYFKEQVRRELVERFGWERVYQGGLRVYTTIDPDMQKAAEIMAEESIRAIERSPAFLRAHADYATSNGGASRLQAALAALDPSTGYVRAMVGGRSFTESHFNRAVQGHRQPGSAFKPFVYAAALETGYTPVSIIDNLADPIDTPQGAYVPEDEHSDAVAMTLRTALRTSSNRAAVHLLQSIGIKRTVDYVGRLNVGSVPSVPSLALGAGEVTLQSLTAGFATFASGGLVRKPTLIRRVDDAEGNVLYRSTDQPSRAISETTAFLMANMLADVINAGTGYRARQLGFLLPAAGKTGTTNDFNDAWFVGFTPRLVAGVWVGFDQPQTITRNGYAGDLAVPFWTGFMKTATRNDKPEWFARPAGVLGVDVCRVSGMLPSEGCYSVEVLTKSGELQVRSMVYTEYFVMGTEPDAQCALHATQPLFDQVAGTSASELPPPAPYSDLSIVPAAPPVMSPSPPEPTATSGDPAEMPEVETPKKKRGFWARIFGSREKDPKKKIKSPQ